jgi:uncharacterized repeat protein (TIGR03803 family)
MEVARHMGTKAVASLIVSFLLVTGGWASTKIINNFTGTDGATPVSPVILDRSGKIYGTTFSGGTYGFGNVYRLSKSGGTWNETVLYNFTGGPDGGAPLGGLVMDMSGNLYGTTAYGGDPKCNYNGASGCGVAFQLTSAGGTWTETVLHTFSGGTDGAELYAGLTIDSKGNLYGVTGAGGVGGCNFGCGTVFRLAKVSGTWKETLLHVFKNNGRDGSFPAAPITLDKLGDIYGTTSNGGDPQGCANGGGIVFKLTKPKVHGGVWKEAILHSFHGGNDGCYSFNAAILDASGNLYGTTYTGGTSGDAGTVYQLKRSGNKYASHVILNLNNSIGAFPNGVVMDSAGNLYGTTASEGAHGCGNVFKLKARGWKYVDVHDFQANSTDGCDAQSGPIVAPSGNLYGSTYQGGSNGDGVVYQITP